jgi:hypothetical protein
MGEYILCKMLFPILNKIKKKIEKDMIERELHENFENELENE